MFNRTTVVLFFFGSLFASALFAEPGKSIAPIDAILVVVNDDMITRNELDERTQIVVKQLKNQGTPLPSADVLSKQILERMIMDMVQIQFAREIGLRVDDVQLDRALERIAQQNKYASLAAFRVKLENDGVNFRKFREEIRTEIVSVRLREREVDSKLFISENEIENYLANQAKQDGKGEEVELAHIMVVVPELASAEKIQTFKRRAEEALSQLRKGASFAQVAAGYSDAKDALQGGNLGWRPSDRIPPLFAEAVSKLKPGETSDILRSPNGFHIIKLIGRRSKDDPIVITQTHARHILIKTSAIVSEHEAMTRLLEIKKAIDKGANFGDQAKLYSEDGSASQGGDLGWLSPGETVPEFEGAMDKLKVGQISDVVPSSFGFHLIQVLERRTADVSVEQKKQQARNAIRSFKSDEAYQDWLRQLRDRAFIEYRNNDK
jgi:peptidyl-prolyl cis-trans isomerase SurA